MRFNSAFTKSIPKIESRKIIGALLPRANESVLSQIEKLCSDSKTSFPFKETSIIFKILLLCKVLKIYRSSPVRFLSVTGFKKRNYLILWVLISYWWYSVRKKNHLKSFYHVSSEMTISWWITIKFLLIDFYPVILLLLPNRLF